MSLWFPFEAQCSSFSFSFIHQNKSGSFPSSPTIRLQYALHMLMTRASIPSFILIISSPTDRCGGMRHPHLCRCTPRRLPFNKRWRQNRNKSKRQQQQSPRPSRHFSSPEPSTGRGGNLVVHFWKFSLFQTECIMYTILWLWKYVSNWWKWQMAVIRIFSLELRPSSFCRIFRKRRRLLDRNWSPNNWKRNEWEKQKKKRIID